jgi:hypothetical protein
LSKTPELQYSHKVTSLSGTWIPLTAKKPEQAAQNNSRLNTGSKDTLVAFEIRRNPKPTSYSLSRL